MLVVCFIFKYFRARVFKTIRKYEQTIRKYEQTIRKYEQTIRKYEQTIRKYEQIYLTNHLN